MKTKSAMKNVTSFAQHVYDIVRKIPKGKTLTYRQVATAAGRPRAFRAVGNILNKNRDPKVPCHRVVRSDGTTGGYAWGATKKRRRLKQEGAKIAR
jgi:methylated-DNA-[protein]-cysteine S-methyltransferase